MFMKFILRVIHLCEHIALVYGLMPFILGLFWVAFFATLKSKVKRTLSDLCCQYFLSDKMVMLRVGYIL